MVLRRPHDTEFRFSKPDARQVFLVGDFNGWQERSLPMSRSEEGDWVCRLELPEGVYQYKYLADGNWCEDRGGRGVGWAPFECNSITVLRERDLPAFPVG
jgi:hypothetical protein